jgi:hypothetical protein
MKKSITTAIIVLVTLGATTSFMVLSGNGMAGYSGSPGEGTCSSCHGGGTSASSGITITATPSFTLDRYLPDSTYDISVQVSAAGFTRYGFDCEILDSLNANTGAMLSAGTGVKFVNSFPGSRRNAVHTVAKTGATVSFDFKWKAPSKGKATIYVAANAVNGNNQVSGDFVLPKTSLILYPVPSLPDPEEPDGISSLSDEKVSVNIYPNPAVGNAHLSYFLRDADDVLLELTDVSGKTVRVIAAEEQSAGEHRHEIGLNDIPSGIYFLKIATTRNGRTVKLISVN